MSAYYKYSAATTTGPWPDVIEKKLMTGKKDDPECHRTLIKAYSKVSEMRTSHLENGTKKRLDLKKGVT